MPLKRLILAGLAVLAGVSASFAQDECKAQSPLENGARDFTGLTLFRFDGHYELQADTPRQGAMDGFAASIDGSPVDLHFSPGLDDLVVVISTHPADLDISPAMLDQLARGSRFELSANAEGRAAQGRFSLKGSAAAVRRLRTNCK